MIRKNIDVIAIALLLAGIGIYSHARQAITFGVVSHGPVVIQRDFRPPIVRVPPIPRVPFSRD